MERKHWYRKERVTDRVTERDTARQKGRAPQPGWICPPLPALVRSQREAGTLKSLAFSDTQVSLVTGKKEQQNVSVPLSRVDGFLQPAMRMLDPVPPLPLPVQGGFTPKFINTEMHSINLTTKENE